MSKKKAKYPKDIDGSGDSNSCFHLCILSDCVRLQVNANDVFYSKDIRQIRKIANYLNKAADYLRDSK